MSKHVIYCIRSGLRPLFSDSLINCCRLWSKPSFSSYTCHRVSSRRQEVSTNDVNKEVDKVLIDANYQELVPPNWQTIGDKQKVLLIMPRQKWGHKEMDINYAKNLMNETIALVNTLPNMKVIDSVMISTLDLRSKRMFGSGNLELLKKRVMANPNITAVVFSIEMLKAIQMSEMESQLGVNIYDRYSIVLNIFKSQANTKEAKLQIALAEIPYIRKNLRALENTRNTRDKSWLKVTGGMGQTLFEVRKKILIEREIKLKKLLDKIESNRKILRQNRERKQYPVIAIIGYTNSGKTSLIKALTHDEKLTPKNQLFATLDVTVHEGRLPSSVKVLFTDTIGFISDIPTALIHSFKATLSEICFADIIVHVLDISHPNYKLHEQVVSQTLDEIQVPEKLKNSIIEVANKVDLVTDKNIVDNCNKLLVSATQRIGFTQLLSVIEKQVIENTKRLDKTLRVANGGPEYQWLYKEAAIRELNVDSNDYNFLILKVFITNEMFDKFNHIFSGSFDDIK
ncbi:putative GTP-binding protein 6 [Oppia nitens]|uniref:putative GTP-binding protein 6 n=1 Tax=Oppia nitens TaxID=1686743 RepID=UPI0023DA6678|nr:putative GTP-binding protein 6 [Oppia nitens]